MLFSSDGFGSFLSSCVMQGSDGNDDFCSSAPSEVVREIEDCAPSEVMLGVILGATSELCSLLSCLYWICAVRSWRMRWRRWTA